MEIPMDKNYSQIRVELGINAQKFIQQVQINNQSIEEQIAKGIELAINDITEGDNFVQEIRHNTKKELENIVNKTVMSWEVRNKITKLVAEKIEAKVEAYADQIADKVTSSLK
jgi:polyribonucleotide nucleotidyltransferase